MSAGMKVYGIFAPDGKEVEGALHGLTFYSPYLMLGKETSRIITIHLGVYLDL